MEEDWPEHSMIFNFDLSTEKSSNDSWKNENKKNKIEIEIFHVIEYMYHPEDYGSYNPNWKVPTIKKIRYFEKVFLGNQLSHGIVEEGKGYKNESVAKDPMACFGN